jgi:hypothetical protein
MMLPRLAGGKSKSSGSKACVIATKGSVWSGVARVIALPMERQSRRNCRRQLAGSGSPLCELEQAGARSSIGSGSVLNEFVDKPATRSLVLVSAEGAVRISEVGESLKPGPSDRHRWHQSARRSGSALYPIRCRGGRVSCGGEPCTAAA